MCDSDTPVELAKIVPMKQPFFFFLHCSLKCSSSYSLHKCGEPAPLRFHVPEITFLDSVCMQVRTSAYKVVHLLVSFPLSLTPGTMLYWRREPSIWHRDKCGGNLSTSKKMLRFYLFFFLRHPWTVILGSLLNSTPLTWKVIVHKVKFLIFKLTLIPRREILCYVSSTGGLSWSICTSGHTQRAFIIHKLRGPWRAGATHSQSEQSAREAGAGGMLETGAQSPGSSLHSSVLGPVLGTWSPVPQLGARRWLAEKTGL